MNIINAGNPSANNMIVRQVMQKNRQSSATIFDKLNKRTAKLTAKNPLNNALTNDQLFRYYIQEVEPKLSQSNDNFSGLPNTTPPDNSIKDTTEKSFGDAGTGGGGGGFGPLNSNDISQPSTSFQNYPLIERLNGIRQQHGEQAEKDVLFNWYTKDRQLYNAYIAENARLSNNPVDVVDAYTHADIFSRAPYPLPETAYDRYNREERIAQQEYDDNTAYTANRSFEQIQQQQSNLQRVLQQLRKSDKTLKQDEVWLLPYPQQEIAQQEIAQQEIAQQVQELGFEPEAENEIWRNYGRPEADWPEAGIDEEAAAGMDFPDYNSGYPSRYPEIPGMTEEFAEYFADLPSFNISNPNYNPRANDGERQFQVIGTPQRVGPTDNRRENFLMTMANYSPHESPGWAASRVVPFTSPVSSSIVPRTALLGRAGWGTQTRSMSDRAATRNLDVGRQDEDPTFDSFMRNLDTDAPLPPPNTRSKKKK
jgi:hypothetical protein